MATGGHSSDYHNPLSFYIALKLAKRSATQTYHIRKKWPFYAQNGTFWQFCGPYGYTRSPGRMFFVLWLLYAIRNICKMFLWFCDPANFQKSYVFNPTSKSRGFGSSHMGTAKCLLNRRVNFAQFFVHGTIIFQYSRLDLISNPPCSLNHAPQMDWWSIGNFLR